MCEKLSRCEKVCKSLLISKWRSQGEPEYVVPNDLPHTGTGAEDMEEQMMFIKVEIAVFFFLSAAKAESPDSVHVYFFICQWFGLIVHPTN